MATPPVIPSAEEVYDSIMQNIEPELTTASIPTLEKKYANETEEERAQRTKRYQKAYAEYDKAYAEYERNLDRQVADYKKDAMKTAEKKSRAEEAELLKQLEQSFS